MNKGIASLLLLMLFIACQKSSVEDVTNTENASTFAIGTIEQAGSNLKASNASWPDLKDQVQVSLRTCLVDTNLYQSVIGEHFTVESEFGTYNVSSDAQGCFVWTEQFDFNYSADEANIVITGKITGKNRFKGVNSYKVAFNPWTGELKDIGKGQSAKNIQNLSQIKSSSLGQQIIIKDFSVDIENINYSGSNVNLDLIYTAKPHLVRMNLNGRKDDTFRLTSGLFENTYSLVKQQNGSSQRVILDEVKTTSFINTEGLLLDKINFTVSQEVPARDRLEILVSSKPMDTPYDIGVATGLIELNSAKATISGSKLNELPLNYDHFYLLADSNTKNFENKAYDHGFLIGEVSGSSLFNDGENQNYSLTTRNYRVDIRMKLVDSLFKESVNSRFYVKIYKKESGAIMFDDEVSIKEYENSGELKISTFMSYDEETPYGFQDYVLEVTGVETPFSGITKSRILYINPRVKGDGFILDSDVHPKPSTTTAQIPEIYLKDFQIKYINSGEDKDYIVDENLELLTNRVVQVELSPKLFQRNNYNGDSLPEITSGRYKVSLMVMSPNEPNLQYYNKELRVSDYTVLTADFKDDVLIENGKAVVHFKLPHNYIKKQFLTMKNLFVLKMSPANKRSQIRPGYVFGTGVLIDPNSKIHTVSKIESLYDTRMKSSQFVSVISRNKLSVDKLEKMIPKIQDSFTSEKYIGDRLEAFKRSLEDLPNEEITLVIDHENYKRKQAKANYKLYKNYKEMKKGDILRISKRAYDDFVYSKKTSKKLFEELCNVFYPANQPTVQFKKSAYHERNGLAGTQEVVFGIEYKQCLEKPELYFSFKSLKVMNKITKQPGELREEMGRKTVYHDYKDLGRSTAYFLSKGKRYDDTTGTRDTEFTGFAIHGYVDTSLGIAESVQKASSLAKTLAPFKLFGAIGPEYGRRSEEFNMMTESQVISDLNRDISQDGNTFGRSEVEVTFEAEYTKCLLVQPLYVKKKIPYKYDNSSFSSDKREEVNVSSTERRVYCDDDRLEVGLITEKWFLLTLNSHNIDGDMTLASNSHAHVIRGEAAYSSYKDIEMNENLKRNSAMKILVSPDANEEIVKRYKTYIQKQGKEIPFREQAYLGFPGLYEPYNE